MVINTLQHRHVFCFFIILVSSSCYSCDALKSITTKARDQPRLLHLSIDICSTMYVSASWFEQCLTYTNPFLVLVVSELRSDVLNISNLFQMFRRW
ncbi:hypothetical protein DEU56DRAFT_160470 [Suillus clintonianus]|uniref:uncharacterized protein n=1 Tax=Suillus clintonianus TaxID=1904413 RepID=UPI001B88126C|nr:uncharacterized protein DEU56DRAFT_160470 [Suillus clintonianus]KAG2117460.1 hypothetical protein DEU56DRAFT_160470 [Suillus clintonianus]